MPAAESRCTARLQQTRHTVLQCNTGDSSWIASPRRPLLQACGNTNRYPSQVLWHECLLCASAIGSVHDPQTHDEHGELQAKHEGAT